MDLIAPALDLTVPRFGVPAFSRTEWGRVGTICHEYSITRSNLYTVMADPKNGIVSFNLKLRRNQARGVRYILRASMDAFFQRQALAAGVSAETLEQFKPSAAK
jgi:hypothetical protein